MGVPRFTTPTFVLELNDDNLDLTQADNVYVTFKSGRYIVTKSNEDLDISEKEISVYLTQYETSRFEEYVEIQANWTLDGGINRAASETVVYDIDKQLLMVVVP